MDTQTSTLTCIRTLVATLLCAPLISAAGQSSNDSSMNMGPNESISFGNPSTKTSFGTQDQSITTIPGLAFVTPSLGSRGFDPSTGNVWLGSDLLCCLYAPIYDIPHGATITQIAWYISDVSSLGNLTGTLVRQEVAANTGFNQNIASVHSVTSSGSDGENVIFDDVDITFLRHADLNFDGTLETGSWLLRADFGLVDLLGELQLNGVRILWQRQVSPAPATATFDDVPPGHMYHQHVEALAYSGITVGCDQDNYCVDRAITRGEMAVFVAEALGLHWPAM